MRRASFIFLSAFFLIISCQDIKEPEKPNQFLSKSEMKDLVYDMVLLDAAAGVNEKRLEELDIEMLEFLSKKYNIDSTALKQNILYYNLKFEENIEIYEMVKDSISNLEKAYDSISKVRDSLKKLEIKKQDSLKNKESDLKRKIKAEEKN